MSMDLWIVNNIPPKNMWEKKESTREIRMISDWTFKYSYYKLKNHCDSPY